jgi:endonuclease/exonuclease/phosphatase family metal-dependent hydrolase
MPTRRLALPLVLLAAAAVPSAPAAAADDPATVKVMSRNVYLGADLTPGVRAASLQELVNAAGVILKQVDDNKFKVRAKGLAAEINNKHPDLVGMQEVALWRTGPCTESPIPPKAAKVRYDYLKLLLARLNKDKKQYRTVISQPEFDFEVYVNTDGNEDTSAPGCPFGSEINGRLTMRDVILARVGHVETTKPKGAEFDTLLRVKPGGVPVDVTRGWTRVDAKIKGAKKFRFVNTHFEAFDNQKSNTTNHDTEVGNGKIRQAQAKELVAKGGPANSKLPVIVVGDLNSDKKTEVKPGDGLAYKVMLNAGFKERSTSSPFGCCLESGLLTVDGGGKLSDFDHKVDHVMTDTPKDIKLLKSAVTGLKPANGFWDSDHAGLFSKLTLP